MSKVRRDVDTGWQWAPDVLEVRQKVQGIRKGMDG